MEQAREAWGWPSIALLTALFVAGGLDRATAETREWEERPHHLSLITAGTATDEDTAFTLGLDYEYRVNGLFGLGAVVEHAFKEVDSWTLLAVTDLHIWRGLAIQTGPGVEFVGGEGGEDDETEFVYRIGALYEFALPHHLTLSPQLHYDLTPGEDAVVFGLALGLAF